jgi:hypothetical protein
MAKLLDVKQAVEKATEYMSSLLKATDIRLEEVEISDDERHWYITLSGLAPAKESPQGEVQTALNAIFQGNQQRLYKTFTVDATNGSIRSMKIRTLQ